MKATEQFFSCGTVYYAVQGGLTLESVKWRTTKQYFDRVLFTMLYRVALTCESVSGTSKCGHSNESGSFLQYFFSCLLNHFSE